MSAANHWNQHSDQIVHPIAWKKDTGHYSVLELEVKNGNLPLARSNQLVRRGDSNCY